MATVKKGILTPSREWWKHLRWTKRPFWHRERKAAQREVRKLVAEHRAWRDYNDYCEGKFWRGD